jgi:hypothetical protein
MQQRPFLLPRSLPSDPAMSVGQAGIGVAQIVRLLEGLGDSPS